MVVRMVKLKQILPFCGKWFYSGHHMNVGIPNFWPIVSGCITMSLPWKREPTKRVLGGGGLKKALGPFCLLSEAQKLAGRALPSMYLQCSSHWDSNYQDPSLCTPLLLYGWLWPPAATTTRISRHLPSFLDSFLPPSSLPPSRPSLFCSGAAASSTPQNKAGALIPKSWLA